MHPIKMSSHGGMHRGWIRNFCPIGPQKVRISIPGGRRVTRIELLRAQTDVPFSSRAGAIEFTIPEVLAYEVAALEVSLRRCAAPGIKKLK